MKARSLPSVVKLPISPIIEMGHLRITLAEPSRQLLSVWRKSGFPQSWREGRQTFMATDTLSDWLRSQGVTVLRR